jgi:hypothetical protein
VFLSAPSGVPVKREGGEVEPNFESTLDGSGVAPYAVKFTSKLATVTERGNGHDEVPHRVISPERSSGPQALMLMATLLPYVAWRSTGMPTAFGTGEKGFPHEVHIVTHPALGIFIASRLATPWADSHRR